MFSFANTKETVKLLGAWKKYGAGDTVRMTGAPGECIISGEDASGLSMGMAVASTGEPLAEPITVRASALVCALKAAGDFPGMEMGPDGFLTVAGLHSNTRIPTQAGEEWEHSGREWKPWASMPHAALVDGIAHCHAFASTDPTRQQLSGIAIITDRGLTAMVASDGKRLAEYMLPDACDVAVHQAIVPSGAMGLAATFFAEEQYVSLSYSKCGYVAMHGKEGHVICRAIEGRMPDYRSLIPVEFSTVMAVNAHALAEAVKRVTPPGAKARREAVVRMAFRATRIDVSCGEASAPCPATQGNDARDIEVAYTPRFILDALAPCGRREVEWGVSRALVATVVACNGHYRGAIMPVRIK